MMDAYGTVAKPRLASALPRYLLAATLARGADGGAAVGLVRLATSPATGLRHGAAAGGLLAAALTAPHLLGPLVAQQLDRARDGRGVLASACVAHGFALGGGALLLGRVPLVFVAAAVVVAGLCGPLLTGGLSSRLAGIARDDGRGEGWDAVTYGLAGTLGPAVVAALAAATTPLAAVLTLAGASVAAAGGTLTPPRSPRAPRRGAAGREGEAMTVRAALRLIAVSGPLRRVAVATALTAASFGALSVIAVLLGEELGARSGAGASLVAAFGLGTLAGSGLVTAFPLRGEPERLATRLVVVMAVALALCALVPSPGLALAAFALAGASNAPFFTATLAARARDPPERARAQVFVSMAGLKVATASAGTALAGAVSGAGPRALLAAGAALTLSPAPAPPLAGRLTGEARA